MKKNNGFTLVETLVALFVFSVAMLAIIAMCIAAIRGNSFSHRMTQGRFLAQGKLEEFRSVAHVAALVDGNETITGDGKYQRSWAIDDGATAGSKWVTVTVSWDDEKGGHTVAVRSLVRGAGS